MQKFLTFIFISLILFLPFSAGSKVTPKKEQVVYVYISTSKSARCYHASRKCQSLRKSRKVVKVKLSDVQKSHKACKHCYTPSSPLPSREYLEEPLN